MIKTLNCVRLRIKDHQNHTHDRRRVFESIDDKITIYLSLFICFVRGNNGINSGIGTFDTYPKISEPGCLTFSHMQIFLKYGINKNSR